MDALVDVMGPLRVVEHPGDGPPVVLVHGLGGSSENWMRVAPLLAAGHAVHALDLPGFGRTPPAGRPPTVAANVALLAAYVRERVRQPAIFVGNSMGGLLSLCTAAEHPDVVRALVLVDPAMPRAPGAPMDRTVLTMFSLYATPGVGEWYLRSVARRTSPEVALRYFWQICGLREGDLPADVLAAHRELLVYRRTLPWSDATFLGAARSMLRVLLDRRRFNEFLRRVQAPTLILHGARDRLVPVESARAVARFRNDFRYEELADEGHTPMLEAPEAFAARVLAFTSAL